MFSIPRTILTIDGKEVCSEETLTFPSLRDAWKWIVARQEQYDTDCVHVTPMLFSGGQWITTQQQALHPRVVWAYRRKINDLHILIQEANNEILNLSAAQQCLEDGIVM